MSLAVLAATLTTVVVFFPVTFLYGVSKFLFSALALAVAISLFASYFVAMTVIPLFCARFLKAFITPQEEHAQRWRIQCLVQSRLLRRLLNVYERAVRSALRRPALTIGLSAAAVCRQPRASIRCWAWRSFPQTDAGQFTINLKVPTGARIEADRGLRCQS